MCASQLSRSELEKNVCENSDGSRGICCPERSGISSNDVNFNSKPKKLTHDKDKSPDYDDYDIVVKRVGTPQTTR